MAAWAGPRRGTAASKSAVYSCRGADSTWPAGPCSTIAPPCMIATRSHTSATTARSWLISSTDMPSRSRSPRSRSSTSACTVTSSALVGSSASSTSARNASASAIATRCSCPPDSWAGYRSSRSGASSTWRIARAAASAASARLMPCSRSARSTTLPTLNTGLNAMAGLWKMAAIRRPRIFCSARCDSPVSSVPSSRMLPRTVAPTVCARPSTASVVIDLPEPLSPASPTISAAPTPNSSMLTTCRSPNRTWRSRMANLIGAVFMAAGSAAGRAGRAARRRAG